jgi:RNA polymerase sigma-70 factor (ECF subfamily)
MMSFVPWTRPHRLRALDTAALVARMGAGDKAALDELYRREAAPVYRYALALCGNAAWAADATQDAFIALATRPQGFDPVRGALGAYLAGVARHALAAFWREQARLSELPEAGEADADPNGDVAGAMTDTPGAASPEQLLVQAQDGEQVWAALRQMPAVFREALVLVDLQERPYAEAARIAGIETNTLRTRVHRARLKLAALLGADGRSPT